MCVLLTVKPHPHVLRAEIMAVQGSSFEFDQWPRALAQDLKGQQTMRYRLERTLMHGVIGHSDFSGKRCAETALNMMLQGLVEEHVVPIPEGCLQWWRSADLNRHCLALAQDARVCPAHVFGELLSRVPLEHAEELKRLRPEANADLEQKEAAYQAQYDYLESHGKEIFTNVPKGVAVCCTRARAASPSRRT